MICRNCGKVNPDNQRFCTGCGADMIGSAPGSAYNQASGFNNTPDFNQAPGFGTSAAGSYTVVDKGRGFAIASLVLGIVSFFCFGIIAGVLGIIFGCVAKSKGSKSPMATAGIVCGAIGAALALLLTILTFSGMFYLPLY